MKSLEKVIFIKIPKEYVNCTIGDGDCFYADTGDSFNWDTIRFPLPKGKWFIENNDFYGNLTFKRKHENI